MSDISDMQSKIRQFCQDRDWDQFHNPKDLALSLMLESAEVLEHFQWKNDHEATAHIRDHKDDIAEELSDVLYWTLRMADKLDIDIVDAFNKKLTKNSQKYPTNKAKGNHKKYTELQS